MNDGELSGGGEGARWASGRGGGGCAFHASWVGRGALRCGIALQCGETGNADVVLLCGVYCLCGDGHLPERFCSRAKGCEGTKIRLNMLVLRGEIHSNEICYENLGNAEMRQGNLVYCMPWSKEVQIYHLKLFLQHGLMTEDVLWGMGQPHVVATCNLLITAAKGAMATSPQITISITTIFFLFYSCRCCRRPFPLRPHPPLHYLRPL
jgi:hypothetical protein